jgi:malate dehydrogenase (oxaloacetate-decarboxylating)(NADP+)
MRTLAEAMKGADVFMGVSTKDVVSKEMVASMNERPIIFAMANPDPEITYHDALSVRSDLIMGTGRSDFPNQVNNVLGFPFIFRGALDVLSTDINEEMKVAASHALADLAKQDVPDSVIKAYGNKPIHFGRDYVIPKPFDPRVLIWEASAVAKAAMDTGAAKIKVDIEEYKHQLEARLGKHQEVMRIFIEKAKSNPKKIVFPEGNEVKILRACQSICDEGLARPVLLGKKEEIEKKMNELHLNCLTDINIIDPETSPKYDAYAEEFFKMRQRKGVTRVEAKEMMKNPNFFGSMMVHTGDADGLVSGLTKHYPETIRPALEIVRMKPEFTKVCGLYMMIFKDDVMFFADTTVNIDPSAEALAEIAINTADTVRRFGIEPKVAMLSFSNFGSTEHPSSLKVNKAVEIVKAKKPDLVIDGEMQANTAVSPDILSDTYPFSKLKEKANVLIFPDLNSGNIAYKLMEKLGGATAVGPILMGMNKSVHVLQRGDSVDQIVNLTSIAVVDAQEH